MKKTMQSSRATHLRTRILIVCRLLLLILLVLPTKDLPHTPIHIDGTFHAQIHDASICPFESSAPCLSTTAFFTIGLVPPIGGGIAGVSTLFGLINTS